MANNQNKSGCINFIFLLTFAPLILFAVGKGCISCASEFFKNSSRTSYTSSKPKEKDNHAWGENGVDPVLRTSTGGIYKDPNFPNHYFDITTTCPQCNGKGQWETIKPNPNIYDAQGNLRTNVPTGSKETVKCSVCYGTGYEKRPIPSDSKIPLKPYPKK